MKLKLRTLSGCLAMFLWSTPIFAQEWVFGLGYSEYNRPGAENTEQFNVEYQHTPFMEVGKLTSSFAGAVELHASGDFFIGAGIVSYFHFTDRVFFETSIMPGAFSEGPALNDLGSTFQIRSLFAFGYRFHPRSAVSVGFAHKSNASTADLNPGVNTYLIRWHRRF